MYSFPVRLDRNSLNSFVFSKWENDMNAYNKLRIEFLKPNFLNLYRADTICPAPKMPFVDLGYFKDNNKQVELIIQASVMQHEVSLEDYYTYFTKISKEQIVNQRLIENDVDKPDFLLTKEFDDGQTWITRRTGFKTWMGKGAFLITLNFACNEQVYNKYADLFFYLMNGVQLREKSEYHLAEKLKLFARKHPMDFGTYVPLSWRESSEHMDTMVHMKSIFKKTYRGSVTGIMNINTMKLPTEKNDVEASFEFLLKEYLKPYLAKGLDINALKFSKDSKVASLENSWFCNHDFAFYERDVKVIMNIKIFIAKVAGCWLYLDMIGISKNTNFEIWAINKRAFQLAMDNIKTI